MLVLPAPFGPKNTFRRGWADTSARSRFLKFSSFKLLMINRLLKNFPFPGPAVAGAECRTPPPTGADAHNLSGMTT